MEIILMKAKIKYALVLNEALRSALNYDTPDEQINEFIRFFGKHIGSDRIYIFEDIPGTNYTRNTYEWCSDGVVPQIGELQNVEVSTIDWWYEAFDSANNIIIPDLKKIKDTHKASYDLLSPQDIHRLVVCPLRYKGEINGFFGVDNPPEGDVEELSDFLAMIGALLISFIKLRNTFNRSNEEARLSSFHALSEIYLSMHLVNVKTGKFVPIKSAGWIDEALDKNNNDFPKQINKAMNKLCTEKHLKSVLDFVDISTLSKRLAGKKTVAHEYLGNVSGWCRERFIVVDYDENGGLEHVLYCVEVIDEDKRRENRLLYLSETDLMTGISNRGCGERKIREILEKHTDGLLCLLDCDKFKSVNDTYGHAVGDAVIVAVAETLQKSCRDSDIVLRLGGDEFAIFLPGMRDMDKANDFFSRLFANLETIAIPEMNNKKIFVSLGASFCRSDEIISFDKLYHEADSAMYKSKKYDGYCATIYTD